MTSMPSEVQVQKQFIEGVLEQFPELKFDVLRINRFLEQFGNEHGIPVLEILRPLLAARDKGVSGLHYTLYDSHMTPKAHEILAQALAEELVVKGLVPKKDGRKSAAGPLVGTKDPRQTR